MLQKFGLIKYNKKFLLENNLNINPIYSPRTIKAKNYFNLKPNTTSNNLNNKLYNKNSNSSRNYKYNSQKKFNTKNLDNILLNNINRFISESLNTYIDQNSPFYLIHINHNINDNPIKPNKISTSQSFLKQSKKKNNINKNNLFKRNLLFSGILQKNTNENVSNNIMDEISIKEEINNKKEKIEALIINNDNLLNKIKLTKKEHENNLKNSNEIDKNLNSNLNNTKNEKEIKEVFDKELFYLKKNIIELKNRLSILNREQMSINLILFKEKIENDLLKEDINKMNRLIENINRDIEETKKEISLIQNQNKKIIMEQRKNLFNENK